MCRFIKFTVQNPHQVEIRVFLTKILSSFKGFTLTWFSLSIQNCLRCLNLLISRGCHSSSIGQGGQGGPGGPGDPGGPDGSCGLYGTGDQASQGEGMSSSIKASRITP